MAKAIGIDLGTTNSVAFFFDGQKLRLLLNAQNEDLTPSVVSLDEDGELAVGRPAVNQARLYPEHTIFSIKRLMGRPFNNEHVQSWKQKVNYHIVESQVPVKGLATVTLRDKQYMPEDISAMILAEIKRYSQTVLGGEVTHAVVTVPAYFGEPERAATREAGKKAGLIVKTLLPEPTAAAIAFGGQVQSQDGNFILVFDLGGGTFDISIISLVHNDYNVMKIHGDRFLGGDDFDAEIVALILKHVRDKHGVDLSEDRRFRVVAKAEAEAAKKALSQGESTKITIPDYTRPGEKPITVSLKVTRDEFERAIRPHVQRCKDLVREAMAEQGLTPDVISDVLLVGGSTAVPLVHRAVCEIFGANKIRKDVNPMHCVAMGAAVLAHRMKGIECPRCKKVCDESLAACPSPGCGESLAAARSVLEEMEVTDITAHHFGIQAVSGSDALAFKPLVEKGSRLPMDEPKRQTFYTTEEGQNLIRVPVFEGLGRSVTQNIRIGVIDYPLPTGLAKNHPVHVDLQLDRQSIVTVTVEVEGLGLRKEVSLKRELSDQVEEDTDEEPLIEDEDEEGDEKTKHLAILENYVGRGRQFVADYEPILSPTQLSRLNRAIAEAQDIVETEKADAAMEAIINLDKLMARCGTASLIDQAHLAANAAGADEEMARKLHQAADQLRTAADRNDANLVRKLSDPIASMIRQVHQQLKGIERIDAAKTYGGLLRDRTHQSS